MEILAVRRSFGQFHDELRNLGLNPLEAVEMVATLVVAEEGERGEILAEFSPQARSHAQQLLSDRALEGGQGAVAFQEFLASQARNGLGQYLTPLPVARMVGEVVGNRLSPASVVLDPFCGSGLLLEETGKVADVALIGVEINSSVATVAHAFAHLSPRRITLKVADVVGEWSDGSLPPVDAAVTNPPFGAIATSVSRDGLERAGVPDELLRMEAIPAELLGFEISLQVLREGGVLGIVMPQSFLTNKSWSSYRASVFSRLELFGVVVLPEETFAPFRGVAKACVIFGRRKSVALPSSAPFYRSLAIGYDGTGRPSGTADLAGITEAIVAGAHSQVLEVWDDGTIKLPVSKMAGGHPRLPLGQIAAVFRGKNPPKADFHQDPGLPWMLKVGDLRGSFVEWRERPKCHVTRDFFERNRALHLRTGDICLTGSAHRPSYIGLKVDLIDELPPSGVMPSGEVVTIRLKSDAPIEPEELLFYLRSSEGYTQMQDLVRGSTGHLYPGDLLGLEVPLPAEGGRQALIKLHREAAESFRAYRLFEEAAIEEAEALFSGNFDGTDYGPKS